MMQVLTDAPSLAEKTASCGGAQRMDAVMTTLDTFARCGKLLLGTWRGLEDHTGDLVIRRDTRLMLQAELTLSTPRIF